MLQAECNWVRASGFSLIEVLVALLILGLVLGATSQLVGSALNTIVALEANTLGGWVAMNQISRAQLEQTPEGQLNGTDEMAGRIWYWRQIIQATPEPALLEIVIEVRTSADERTHPVAIERGFRRAVF